MTDPQKTKRRHFLLTPHIFFIAIKRFFAENLTYRASAMAFTSLFALVPFLFVVFFFVNTFPVFGRFIILAKNYVLANFVPNSADAIQFYFHGFLLQASRLPTINLLFLIVSVTMLVYTIEETLNDIWKVSHRSKINGVIVIYWLVFLLMPLIIGMSVFVSSYIFGLAWVTQTTNRLGITALIISMIPIPINTMIFGMLYKFMPNTYVKWGAALFGGFLASIFFELARIGFAFYVHQFPSYALIYGAFAVIPIFLIWLYIFWCVVLFCALIVNISGK